METIHAIILGIVQGLTEFLPVSSSGHLQLAKELLGVDPTVGGLTFDLTLHAATVLSTFVVLWSEIKRLIIGLFSRRFNEQQAYILKIILSMVPVVIVGFTLESKLEMLVEDLPNHRILLVVGSMLLLTALLLYFAYRAKPRRKETISYRDAFVIGIAQAVATLPGLSRSGTTIATGLILGNNKESVAKFSFLMVLAPILGKTLLDLMSGEFSAQAVGAAPMLAGFLAAFIVGCLACKFMIGIVKRGKLSWFALYCAIVGLLSIVSYFVIQ
ncbi:MAG TPA: undecaprenyl-diphosphate phosphatase [Candidatus Alistipes avicola]|uniref:Undecaprenyl-diphosphatase n=1 Tax=Candidatus Alistipes avicola TaxID=2838432 RepID=A0A9D2L4C7_9BACT|nr:undecaprenyl-diphosphate phosphatase [uncultured Alistipes sp.]HJA99030.1 undecaprenyl-diphosphate phosphatase [Candidatus Alistipes avicola]